MSSAPRLVAPKAQAKQVTLTETQQELVALPSKPCVQLILGGAGTGKTTVLKRRALELAKKSKAFENSIIITSSRATGDVLRSDLSALSSHDEILPPVKTWQALAFDIVKRAEEHKDETVRSSKVRLLSGAEQDALLAEMLTTYENSPELHLTWPAEHQMATKTANFRKNIRDFFDICAERAISAQELEDFARDKKNELFVVLAQVYDDYLKNIVLRFPEAYAPAELMRTAIASLEQSASLRKEISAVYQHMMIDDLQDSSLSHLELLKQMVGKDSYLLAVSNPDVTVQAFRGAIPGGYKYLKDIAEKAKVKFNETNLLTCFSFNGEIAQLYDHFSEQLADSNMIHARYNKIYPASGSESRLVLFQADNEVDEEELVVDQLNTLHVKHDVPWGECAVIARNHRQIARFEYALRQNDIPVRIKSSELPLNEEKAVVPLVEIFGLSQLLSQQVPDKDVAETVEKVEQYLRNVYIGMTGSEMRKFRQQLRILGRKRGDYRGSDALIIDALNNPEVVDQLQGPLKDKFLLFTTMLEAAELSMKDAEMTAVEALWQVWAASEKEKPWEEKALSFTSERKLADHYLDTVVALFTLATRFGERQEDTNIEDFVTLFQSKEVVEDLLVQQSAGVEGVHLLTPAAAVGREFECVVVPGLQEGVWPQQRIIADVFGTKNFVNTLKGEPVTLFHEQQKELYREELRMFLNAVSRANKYLMLSAISSEENQLSPFFIQAAQLSNRDVVRGLPHGGRTYSIDSIVVQLRKILEDPESSEVQKKEAADLLAIMKDEPGASPQEWWGVSEYSTHENFYDEDEEIRVSPSTLEKIHKCPLCWFVNQVGGTASSDYARSLGTLIHEIAEKNPEADAEELKQIFLERWGELGQSDTWENKREQERILKMVGFIAEYAKKSKAAGREVVGRELEIKVPLKDGKVILKGMVDVVEMTDDGALFAADYKTGKNAPKKEDVPDHMQLRAYQYALSQDGLTTKPNANYKAESAGAALVNLGTKNKGLSTSDQESLDEAGIEEVESLILEAAGLMSGSAFLAKHDPTKDSYASGFCDVPQVCPLCDGKQVTQR